MANILIADDSATETALISRVVTDLGHRSFTASNGQECLEKADQSRPDLILLDVVMPTLDGFSTCRRLRKNPETATIPVVMVTSKNGDSDRFWAERQGANAYVTKPFDATYLGETIQRFVG
jgi:twitching motility two-component system response regulator PilH